MIHVLLIKNLSLLKRPKKGLAINFGQHISYTKPIHPESNCAKEGIQKANIWDHFTFHPQEETVKNCSIRLGISLIKDIRKLLT